MRYKYKLLNIITVLTLTLLLSACGSSDDNTTTNPSATIKTLNLKVEKDTLNKDTNTTISVKAVYKDNTIKDITDKAEWIIDKKDAIKITNHTLKALKDTNVTLQAKVGKVTSNPVKLVIYWEVNGHRLPPEPDPKVNNSTLLGVDVNHNGVRDDVERWIYKTYKHPIERGIMLQNANRLQTQISNISKAHDYAKLSDKSLSCEYYLEETYEWFRKKYEYSITSKEIKKIQFNNSKRYIEYQKYNAQFNGEVFESKILPDKDNCTFDKNGTLKVAP